MRVIKKTIKIGSKSIRVFFVILKKYSCGSIRVFYFLKSIRVESIHDFRFFYSIRFLIFVFTRITKNTNTFEKHEYFYTKPIKKTTLPLPAYYLSK